MIENSRADDHNAQHALPSDNILHNNKLKKPDQHDMGEETTIEEAKNQITTVERDKTQKPPRTVTDTSILTGSKNVTAPTVSKTDHADVVVPANENSRHVYTLTTVKPEIHMYGGSQMPNFKAITKRQKFYDKPKNIRVVHVFEFNNSQEKGSNALYGPETFEGACLDSGAEQSVIGSQQAASYTKATGRKTNVTANTLIFRFGDGESESLGVNRVRISLPYGEHVVVSVHVVNSDITLLIGMEVLCSHKLILDFGNAKIRQGEQTWTLPMVKKNGHTFIQWGRIKIC